jgi:antitoxin component YwqK of YwqJK toxin-antitoxin module
MKEKKILLLFLVLWSGLSSCNKDYEKDLEYFSTFHPNGKVNTIGTKHLGKMHGKAFVFYENGEKWLEHNYEFGVQNGEQLEYRNGRLFSIENFVEDKRDGWAKYYDPECVNLLFREGRYSKDKQEGYWVEYYGKAISSVYLYKEDSLMKVIYKNPDHDQDFDSPPLPPYSGECCCSGK